MEVQTIIRKAERCTSQTGTTALLSRPCNVHLLTLCARDGYCWLAQSVVHRELVQLWCAASAWRVGHYLVMPDRLHLFCAPAEPTVSITAWSHLWKTEFRRRHPGQPWHWDVKQHVTAFKWFKDYEAECQRILNEPVRTGWAQRPQDWPFTGQIHDLGS